MHKNILRKYMRQVMLKGFGIECQEKLLSSSVLVVGAGGLGCPALQYLAASGIGKIGIVDFDKVEVSNLHRQILFSENDLGKPKAIIAGEKITALNNDLSVEVHDIILDEKNGADIISGYDVVIDGTDNFQSRYAINDACVLLDKPFVYGAVFRYEGQLAIFNFLNRGSKTTYRDLFPDPPRPNEIPDCSEAGVIGVLPGIIGTMQAAEAIKIISGIGEVLANRLLTYNMLTNSFYEVEIAACEKNHI
jgi:adenylyltransferase/sulfurtransferase